MANTLTTLRASPGVDPPLADWITIIHTWQRDRPDPAHAARFTNGTVHLHQRRR